MQHPPIYILGQGAIGSLLAAKGQESKLNTIQIVRGDTDKNSSVELNGKVQRLTSKTQLKNIKSIDFLVIPTKAYDVENVLKELKPLLTPGAQVILSHNGLGTIELCKSLIGDIADIYFCTTSTGAYAKNNVIHLAGIGKSEWALVSKSPLVEDKKRSELNVKSVISTLFFNATQVSDILPVLWNKLAVNAVINPISAIHNCLNGDVLDHQHQQLTTSILEELVLVAKQQGLELKINDLKKLVVDVANQTKHNSSSMREDVLNGRQTEIDFINGYIANQASLYQIPAPANTYITNELKALQRL